MSSMSVCFWGTRGSIPTPGRRTERYGGNTTCVEVRYEDQCVILDAGSGIRELGASRMRLRGGEQFNAHLLLTHLHWDHIQGFPFFGPAYVPGNKLSIYGQSRSSGGLKDLLGGQMGGDFFPVPFDAMQADVKFYETTADFQIGPIRIQTISLPHPGGCLGYRLEAGGHVFVFATDNEMDQVAVNQDEVVKDFDQKRQYEPQLMRFLEGANLLVLDCQHTDKEYQAKRGWGHNSVATTADLIAQVQPDMVALTHHDPENDDGKVAAMVVDTIGRAHSAGAIGTLIFAAREGMTLKVEKPILPMAIST